jgi:nucleoside-diphosphate-sugar epimerase
VTSALDTIDVAEKIVGIPAIRINRAQRYGQTFHENISIEKAKHILGWEPKTTFYDGMKFCFENDERFKD